MVRPNVGDLLTLILLCVQLSTCASYVVLWRNYGPPAVLRDFVAARNPHYHQDRPTAGTRSITRFDGGTHGRERWPPAQRRKCGRHSPAAAVVVLRAAAAAGASSPSEDGSTFDPYRTATVLLEVLRDRRSKEIDGSFGAFLRRLTPSYEGLRQREAARIESLVDTLLRHGQTLPTDGNKRPRRQQQQEPYTYDPTESLVGGGFFCTLYWFTPNMPDAPPPIWELLSLKASNVKGQQYYERNDFTEAVINYSEIWGPALHLTAEGTFAPLDGVEPAGGAFRPPFGGGLFWKKRRSRLVGQSRRLRTCPDVFRVDATRVTLHVLGTALLPLPIKGSSNLVVLYADPRLRVFVSPTESRTVVGNWEEAGLVVVQVRSDLVGGSSPADLR